MGLNTPISPKRPFKGKGERLVRGGGSAPAAFPAIANTRDAEHWLQVFEAERREVLDALHDVQQRFAAEVNTPPASLVSRRGGGLIWRLRAAVPLGQTLFELTSATGRSLIQDLPPRLRRLYLDAEAERLRLNARWSIANTAVRSLAHYLDRYRQVRAWRKSSGSE
ncbi:MAG: hypothetical protein ACREYE_24030 [Gammaproteobacteria bacterium]